MLSFSRLVLAPRGLQWLPSLLGYSCLSGWHELRTSPLQHRRIARIVCASPQQPYGRLSRRHSDSEARTTQLLAGTMLLLVLCSCRTLRAPITSTLEMMPVHFTVLTEQAQEVVIRLCRGTLGILRTDKIQGILTDRRLDPAINSNIEIWQREHMSQCFLGLKIAVAG